MCNKIEVPPDVYFYIEFHTVCVAEPEKGFQFSSWVQNFQGNLSRTIKTATLPDSPLYTLFNALHIQQKDPSANLTIDRFGNFTATFEKLPPAVPTEYLIPLYGVVASSIIGWSIPSILGWIKARKIARISKDYHERINALYDDGKLDYGHIDSLDKLRGDLSDVYAKGAISDEHYQNLKDEITVLYEEIYSKRIDSITERQDIHNGAKLLHQVKYDIDDAFAKGKISEQHYKLLIDKISDSKNTQQSDGNLPASPSQSSASTSTTQGSPFKS